MDVLWIILAQGAILSVIIDFAKGFAVVKAHPKLIAAGANLAVVLVGTYWIKYLPAGLVEVLLAILGGFTAAVATHEVRDAVIVHG